MSFSAWSTNGFEVGDTGAAVKVSLAFLKSRMCLGRLIPKTIEMADVTQLSIAHLIILGYYKRVERLCRVDSEHMPETAAIFRM